MAVSAFRSTTRRSCQVGSSAEASVPSTPRARSKRDSSPARKGSHRRSTSMTDFSLKYMSDTDYRPSTRGGRRHSACPSDSESDMECFSVYPRHGGRSADSDNESSNFWVANANNNLRRTTSSLDIAARKDNDLFRDFYNRPKQDDNEDLVEEKTIKAVYAQMKSLRTDPPMGDAGTSNFLDAMRNEVRRAVDEIRKELKESMQKSCNSSVMVEEGNIPHSEGADVIQAVADIRKEYSTKLEQSEKRVRELWSQLAVEEQRCVELSKIVKELLPPSSSSRPGPLQGATTFNKRRSHRRKNSAEKQLLSKRLDDEAYKYFEECVSLSPFDFEGESDGSNSTKTSVELAAKDNSQSKNNQQTVSLVENDGVVLPWLQWGAEAGTGDKDLKKAGRIHSSPKTSSTSRSNVGNNHLLGSNIRVRSSMAKRPAAAHGSINVSPMLQKSSLTVTPTAGSNHSVAEVAPGPAVQPSKVASSSLFIVEEKMVHEEHYLCNVDIFMFERIRFRQRIERGELLMCHSLFFL